MNGREKVNGHLLLTACLSRRCRGHQMRQLNAGHRELLQQSPGGLQGPKVWRGLESNWEIKRREVPGCWKGWEAPGAGGLQDAGQEQAKECPPPCHCCVPCPGLGHLRPGVAHPRSCRGFGGGPASSACPRSISDPQNQGCTSGVDLFLKHRQDLLSPQIHLQVSRRLGHNPPGGGLTNCRVSPGKSSRDTQGQLFTRHTSQRCSPMQDRIAGGGGYRGSPAPAPPRSLSPRPQLAACSRSHAWPARRVSTGSAQPRRGALTSVTNTPAPAKAGLPGQAEN